MVNWLEIGLDAQGGHLQLLGTDGLRIRLPENPTTGYRWVLMSCGTLQPVADSFSLGGSGIGAGGTRLFDLRPTATGPQSIRLALRQEWEAGIAPLDQLELTVDVM